MSVLHEHLTSLMLLSIVISLFLLFFLPRPPLLPVLLPTQIPSPMLQKLWKNPHQTQTLSSHHLLSMLSSRPRCPRTLAGCPVGHLAMKCSVGLFCRMLFFFFCSVDIFILSSLSIVMCAADIMHVNDSLWVVSVCERKCAQWCFQRRRELNRGAAPSGSVSFGQNILFHDICHIQRPGMLSHSKYFPSFLQACGLLVRPAECYFLFLFSSIQFLELSKYIDLHQFLILGIQSFCCTNTVLIFITSTVVKEATHKIVLPLWT